MHMKLYYVEFRTDKKKSGHAWTSVKAACEYDAKIIIHNALYVPLEDIYLVSECK